MTPSRKALLLPTLLILLTSIISSANTTSDSAPEFNEQEITARLQKMTNQVIKPRSNSIVQAYIKGYVTWGRDKSERILGRSVLYFPIFEKYLKESNLPSELKYLSVVESALYPKAVSPVGAGGLWQFMPPTAEEMGLQIDRHVDERYDPDKSTAAAMKYITKLYNQFGDWELALAAYNSGAGRVSRAIKRARSRNFWNIHKYLPGETRNYVPAYIAASYLMEYYEEHQLQPNYPDLDMQMTETIKVFESLPFLRISKLTGMPIEAIQDLNPSYLQDFIPSNENGNNLTLPRRVMPAVKSYLKSHIPDQSHPEVAEETADNPLGIEFFAQPLRGEVKEYYQPSVYQVEEGETLESIAALLESTVYQLEAWNKTRLKSVKAGQQLKVYTIKKYVEYEPVTLMTKVDELETLPPPSIQPLAVESETDHQPEEKYLYYTVSRKETLAAIAAKHPGVTVRDLMILNNYKSNEVPNVGEKIKVKKM